MPRTPDRKDPEWMASARRQVWKGTGDAWVMVSDLIAGTVVWGAIGFGLDRWLGTDPVLMVTGALVGHIASIALVLRKARLMREEATKERGQGS